MKDLIRKQDLDCVQLIVPIALEDRVEGLWRRLALYNCIGGVGGVVGCAGGLTVLWRKEVNVKFIGANQRVLALKVCSDPECKEWLLMNVYGFPYFSQRHELWKSLDSILEYFDWPWVAIQLKWVISSLNMGWLIWDF